MLSNRNKFLFGSLAIAIGCYFFYLRWLWGPFWGPKNQDPSYLYLFLGMKANTDLLSITQSPAVPLIYLSALVTKIFLFIFGVGGRAQIISFVFENAENILFVIFAIATAGISLSTYWGAVRIEGLAPGHGLGYVYLISFYFIPGLSQIGQNVSPELLLVILGGIFSSQIIRSSLGKNPSPLSLAVVSSLSLLTKVTSILFVPMALYLTKKGTRINFFIIFFSLTAILIAPMISELPSTLRWILSIFLHDGPYGSGAAIHGIFPADPLGRILSIRYSSPMEFVLILGTAILLSLRGSNDFLRLKNTTVLLSLLFLLQLVFFHLYPNNGGSKRYFFALSVLLPALSTGFFLCIRSNFFRLIYFSFIIFIGVTENVRSYQTATHLKNETKTVTTKLSQLPKKCRLTYTRGAPSQVYALYKGNGLIHGYFNTDFHEHFPDFLTTYTEIKNSSRRVNTFLSVEQELDSTKYKRNTAKAAHCYFFFGARRADRDKRKYMQVSPIWEGEFLGLYDVRIRKEVSAH